MLKSVTTVLERRVELTSTHFTHPFEVGWASQAIAFVRVEGVHPPITIQPEISPDGIHWVSHNESQILSEDEDMVAVHSREFGNWIRFAVKGATQEAPVVALIHLALKG